MRTALLLTLMLSGCGQEPPASLPPADATLTSPIESNHAPGKVSRLPGVDGVYCTADEMSGFSGTILELRGGRFRYWFYSDVRSPDNPQYPIEGDYLVEKGLVRLSNENVNQREWFTEVINGVPVLLRQDARDFWRRDRRIYDYGVLLKVDAEADSEPLNRPSITELFDEEMRKRNPQWKDPFVHGPQ